MPRQAFAIDEAKDEDEDDVYAIGEDDDVMDEVDAFLEAHDSGLTDTQRAEAKGTPILPLERPAFHQRPRAAICARHEVKELGICQKENICIKSK